MNKFIKIIATFFYVGEMPIAPGTLASLAGALLSIAVFQNIVLYLVILAIVLAAGFYASGKMEKIIGEHDPSCVVIDEVAGVMITFFLLPFNLPVLIVAFFLFRAFDMFKIYPANHLEKLNGGLGIMADDIMAGVYANVLMQIVVRIFCI
ncbi:MAG: phosphatidylglycerophosphatase A, partial [Candidatus Omnitrophica bacterium]|nr:phosphatidylglycerophosphatase A [Candidatus Omnitrophota bacterium]